MRREAIVSRRGTCTAPHRTALHETFPLANSRVARRFSITSLSVFFNGRKIER